MAEAGAPALLPDGGRQLENPACRIPTWHILFVTAYAFTATLLFGPHVTHETARYFREISTVWVEDHKGSETVTRALDLATAMENLVRLFFTLAIIHFAACVILLILFMIAADSRHAAVIRCWDTAKFFAGVFTGMTLGIAGQMAWIVLTRK